MGDGRYGDRYGNVKQRIVCGILHLSNEKRPPVLLFRLDVGDEILSQL